MHLEVLPHLDCIYQQRLKISATKVRNPFKLTNFSE